MSAAEQDVQPLGINCRDEKRREEERDLVVQKRVGGAWKCEILPLSRIRIAYCNIRGLRASKLMQEKINVGHDILLFQERKLRAQKPETRWSLS